MSQRILQTLPLSQLLTRPLRQNLVVRASLPSAIVAAKINRYAFHSIQENLRLVLKGNSLVLDSEPCLSLTYWDNLLKVSKY
jgi:hypothetical protein